MGCCVSFLSRDNSNPPHATATTGVTPETEDRCTDTTPTTTTATTTPNATTSTIVASNTNTHPTTVTAVTAFPTATRRPPIPTAATTQFPLSEHFNAPIRPHIWYSKHRVWTRTQLDRERREFFETRVTGRPEIWTALAAVISFMRDGDVSTAQSIVDAAGITVPTGDLCQGCYDEQGALYRLPQCIVSDPENMISVNTAAAGGGGGYSEEEDDYGQLATDDASGDELISEDLEQRRDEKGKTSERDLISVRARLSDRGGLDLVLSVGKNQSVGFIARKIQQEADVSRHQSVRLLYLGKILKGHTSLLEQGWQPGQVINAFIVTRTSIS